MNKILCKITEPCRVWQSLLLTRLQAAGYTVGFEPAPSAPRRSALNTILRIEARRFGASLAQRTTLPGRPLGEKPDLVLDLGGLVRIPDAKPTLHITWNGQPDLEAGIAAILKHRALPELVLWLDGTPVAIARPMMSDRLWMSRICDELLAGAIGLIEGSVKRFLAGTLEPMALPPSRPAPHGFLRHHLPHLARAGAGRALHKLRGGRPFYWQVAYRHHSQDIDPAHPTLGSAPFSVLPDDGERFYADPFLISMGGRRFLFIEEFPYALGRGVISVSEQDENGQFGRPREVLRQPHHLSYPQVFTRGGDVFMLPESGGAGKLVLYRAAAFPHDWVEDTVLIDGADINDATLVENAGTLFLFATERLAPGSASDRMVVFHAATLRGPWIPHPLNPITIDRAGARPGGALMRHHDRLWLKVQDGSDAYGGGLGMREVLRLDTSEVCLGPVIPVAMGAAWDRAGIHTFNADGGWQVVDSAG